MMCNHPNIEEFITVKSDLDKLNKANLSVKFTDDFFNKLLNDENYELSFTRSTGETISKIVKAKDIYDKFIQNNYQYAEPGVMYIDKINNWNLMSEDPDYIIASGNPCNEAPLPAYGACNLGSFSLVAYVKDGKFDFGEFSDDIPIVVKAMNDILDESIHLLPLDQQKEIVSKYRILGIGIMGLADVFIKLGIRYGSEESFKLSDAIGRILINKSAYASAQLASIYGTFPGYNKEVILKSKFFNLNLNNAVKEYICTYGLRNAQLLSIAPNGSLSNMFGISGGLEPIYATSYERKTESLHNETIKYKIYTPIIQKLMDDLNITDEKDLPDYIITAPEIPYIERITLQAIWQSYIDAAISSTINLPNNATEEDIYNLYIEAWKAGLKGVTVFRDGCARQGILTTDTTPCTSTELKRGDWKPIAEDTTYDPKIKIKTGCGELELFPGWSKSEQRFQEIWIKKIGDGGCGKSIDAIAIEMSSIFRLGGSLYNVEKAFKNLGVCPSFKDARRVGRKLSKGNSCADCILKALQKFETEMKESTEEITEEVHGVDTITNNVCPECGTELASTGGCISCFNCGWSKCE